MTAERWDLRNVDDELVVPDVEGSSDDLLLVVELADIRFPHGAPHCAVNRRDPELRIEAGEISDERLDELNRALDAVLEGST